MTGGSQELQESAQGLQKGRWESQEERAVNSWPHWEAAPICQGPGAAGRASYGLTDQGWHPPRTQNSPQKPKYQGWDVCG